MDQGDGHLLGRRWRHGSGRRTSGWVVILLACQASTSTTCPLSAAACDQLSPGLCQEDPLPAAGFTVLSRIQHAPAYSPHLVSERQNEEGKTFPCKKSLSRSGEGAGPAHCSISSESEQILVLFAARKRQSLLAQYLSPIMHAAISTTWVLGEKVCVVCKTIRYFTLSPLGKENRVADCDRSRMISLPMLVKNKIPGFLPRVLVTD